MTSFYSVTMLFQFYTQDFCRLSMKQPYTVQARYFNGIDKNPHGISRNKKASPMGGNKD